MRGSILLVVTVVVAVLGACRAGGDDGAPWPELGNATEPVGIDTRLLELGDDPVRVFIEPTQSFRRPWDFYEEADLTDPAGGTLRPGVIRHHYPHMTVAGHYHGTGTYVYYEPIEDRFYLWGDDYQGHFDGMVGPFAGDPREVLAAVVHPAGGSG